nr:DUF2637 domain-containing protein [Streptomyces sp. NRRL S-1022]
MLIGVVCTGALIIAGIGFAGSYAAVRELALKKGFGNFAYAFPVGIDAGIVVLLALDLLLTWIRIPFPLLRQTAWLLTAATIAFNGAAAWPDPLGVGMHAVIPVLFVVAVEAARHAIGRIADITADKHMEGVRIARWLLSPVPTFKLWRRMKLWELRSYEQVIKLEQERLVYQARLRQRFGRAWRRKAPVEALMPLRLARYGVPLRETVPAGLEAAGIPVPAELQRLDVREELPKVSVPELEPVQGGVDKTEHHGPAEALDAAVEQTAGPSEPEPEQSVPGTDEVHGWTDLEAEFSGGYAPYGAGSQAGASVPVAARDNGRPHVVQARIDSLEWADVDPQLPLTGGAVGQSPIGDSQGVPFVPGPATSPELPVYEVEDGALDEDEVAASEKATVPEGLAGKELLEYLYLQLPLEQRAPHQSASALARQWHAAAGLTEGSARKYLGDVIRKHS